MASARHVPETVLENKLGSERILWKWRNWRSRNGTQKLCREKLDVIGDPRLPLPKLPRVTLFQNQNRLGAEVDFARLPNHRP